MSQITLFLRQESLQSKHNEEASSKNSKETLGNISGDTAATNDSKAYNNGDRVRIRMAYCLMDGRANIMEVGIIPLPVHSRWPMIPPIVTPAKSFDAASPIVAICDLHYRIPDTN